MSRGTDRLDELVRVLKALPAQLTAATVQVAEDNAVVLEMGNQAQLQAGLDSSGRAIEPAYTAFTVEEKKAKGQPTDRVTLKDSGAFYRAIVAQVRNEEITVVDDDPKSQELQEKYGPDILGVSEESLEAFREDLVRPELEYQTHYLLGI